jgi:hypothetical protein
VPQQVAEAEQAATILSRQNLVVAAEIGDVGNFDIETTILGAPNIGIGLFQRAEMAAERKLLGVVDALIVEHQYGEAVHAGGDCGDLFGADRLGKVDTGNHAGEIEQAIRFGRADFERHPMRSSAVLALLRIQSAQWICHPRPAVTRK